MVSPTNHDMLMTKKMQLLLGTNNPGKVTEISEILSDLSFTLVTPQIIAPLLDPPPETGENFYQNALQKARYYYVHTGHPTVADDSGITVEALGDALGVHTRRWGAGPAASDQEWIEHFLERMRQEENKRAQFVCHLAYVDSDGHTHVFEGVCDGTITDALEAEYLPGLPISACFKPNGFDQVYSAMTIEQKNSTSHRGRALQKLREHFLGRER
jgi:XTP/dITP diphosphohydrolase